MLKLRTAALAAALLLSSSAFATSNLVTNGDFETGDLTGWTASEPALDYIHGVDADFYQAVTHVPHSGFVYYDGTMGHQGTLSQSLGTIAGAVYTLEFDLQRFSAYPPPDNQLTVTFAGHTVLDETNGSNTWQHFSFTGLTASGASSLLQFANRNENDYTELDNVSVIMTAVPEPSIALMMLGGLVLVAYRSRRPPPF